MATKLDDGTWEVQGKHLTFPVRIGDAAAACAVYPVRAARAAALLEGIGLEPVAVYRDPSGALVELSAVCRHLGCLVRWNSGEKTWDCPCHGSRYAANGRVVNGPALTDLPLQPPRP